MEPQWNADRQMNARNRFRPRNPVLQESPNPSWSKYGFARRGVLETVLLDRAAFKVVLEQDIVRRVARHGGRGKNAVLALLECGRVAVAMGPADDPVIHAGKLLKKPVTEGPKSDLAAGRIDGPAIEGNRAWSGLQRNIVTARVAAHVDANTVIIAKPKGTLDDV